MSERSIDIRLAGMSTALPNSAHARHTCSFTRYRNVNKQFDKHQAGGHVKNTLKPTTPHLLFHEILEWPFRASLYECVCTVLAENVKNNYHSHYGQLSPCGNHDITDTLVLQTGANPRQKNTEKDRNGVLLTLATTTFLYYNGITDTLWGPK